MNGDGCNASCEVEDGYVCAGEASTCVSTATCGDGVVGVGESCDDGNNVNGDGCSATCLIEDGV